MGDIECKPFSPREVEILDERHFYAAYVYDKAYERAQDIQILFSEARKLGYPIRYWWLSDVMDLQDYSDRLIICVHHPSTSEDAGMDLYDSLRKKGANWDDLESALVAEYCFYGKTVVETAGVRLANGQQLFPHGNREIQNLPRNDNVKVLLLLTEDDVRAEAADYLGREPTEDELKVIIPHFSKAMEWLDWVSYLDEVIRICQAAGQVGPAADQQNDEFKNTLLPGGGE